MQGWAKGEQGPLKGMTQADIDTRLLAKASRLVGQGFNRKVERMILVLGQLEIIILTFAGFDRSIAFKFFDEVLILDHVDSGDSVVSCLRFSAEQAFECRERSRLGVGRTVACL